MRILIYFITIFLILLAHATVWSQGPIDRDLASLRNIVRYQLTTQGRATGILSNTAVHYAINRAIAQVCTKYPAIAKYDTIITTFGTSIYSLNTDFDRVRIAYRLSSDTLISLQAKRVDSVEAQFAIKKDGVVKYYYTSGQKIFLLPPPNNYDGDTILIDYYAMDAMLSDSTDSTAIPQRYMEKVIQGACAILSATRKEFNDAAWYWNLFDDRLAPLEDLKK